MRKPRMTKREREFVMLISEAIFQNPEIRNGKRYPNSEVFARLDLETQKHYTRLVMTKTY